MPAFGTPVKEYPQFEAALSLLPAVPPEEAVALCTGRGGPAQCDVRKRASRGHRSGREARRACLFLGREQYRLALLRPSDILSRAYERIRTMPMTCEPGKHFMEGKSWTGDCFTSSLPEEVWVASAWPKG